RALRLAGTGRVSGLRGEYTASGGGALPGSLSGGRATGASAAVERQRDDSVLRAERRRKGLARSLRVAACGEAFRRRRGGRGTGRRAHGGPEGAGEPLGRAAGARSTRASGERAAPRAERVTAPEQSSSGWLRAEQPRRAAHRPS